MKSIEQLLAKRTGLDCSVIGPTTLERVVRRRMKLAGLSSVRQYHELMLRSAREYSDFLDEVLVIETWFFRDEAAFSYVARIAGDEWLPGHPAGQLRILSLPCCSGEEPFSIAMSLLDAGLAPDRFRIDAIDISRKALAKARRAVYGKHAFRSKELGFRNRYFRPVGEEFELASKVRESVYFLEANLLSDGFAAPHANYDFIFFRNLLIYLDRPAQTRALEKIARLLNPKGMLFVGPAEQPLALEWGLVSAQRPQTFGCRRKSARLWDSRTPGAFDISLPSRNRSPSDARTGQGHDLAEAGRLADAGRLAEAAAICNAQLSEGQASAQVYYLLGLLRDARGDKQALEYYRKALYLDPNHYESLIHLAVLSVKNGDAAAARNLQRRAERLQPGATNL